MQQTANERAAAARIERTLHRLFGTDHPYRGRVVPVRGDITRTGLGLGRRRRAALCEGVDEIVHGAASVSFEMGIGEARAINVEGTRRVLELADRCQKTAPGGLRRVTYISTAYVAGDHAAASARTTSTSASVFATPTSARSSTVRGRACFGVYADREALPDADRLARDIDGALAELLARTRSAPPPPHRRAGTSGAARP